MFLLRILRFLFLILIVVIIITFALANNIPSSLSFYPLPFQISLPLYLPILLALLCGTLIGASFIAYRSLSLHYKIFSLKRKLSSCQKNLSHLESTINLPPHNIPHAQEPKDITSTSNTITSSENKPSQNQIPQEK